MEKKSLIIRLFAVVTAMMCALCASAVEAYACYTPSNTTLTFYYDNYRSSRTGTTYDLNTGSLQPEWFTAGLFSSITHVIFTPSFADARPTNTNIWFSNMTNLESITGINYLNTSQVKDMRAMFQRCSSLTSLDLSGFNTDLVTNMSWMFEGCNELKSLDVSNFNTANVTDMRYMFYGCSDLTSLDLSCFNTANVTSMNHMFYDCRNLNNLNISNFNTDNVTDMRLMFTRCSSMTSLDLGHFNTENLTSMEHMFSACISLTSLDISNFNTDNVTDMTEMFQNCNKLTSLDLSSFNTAKVAKMDRMFWNCKNLITIYVGSGWSTASILNPTNMFLFLENTSLVGGQGTTYISTNSDATYAHIDGGPSNPGYFTEKPSYIRGDVNGDGSVTIADVSALIDYLLGDPSAAPAGADANQDNSVSISDVTKLIDYLLSGSWD